MTALAKPRTAAAAAVISGPIASTGGTFTMKVKSATLRFSTRIARTTGDGDIGPKYEHNGFLYFAGQIRGMMAAGAALNIGAIARVNSTAPAAPAVMTLTVATGQSLAWNVQIHRIEVDWFKEAVDIPVVMHVSGTAGTLTET